MTGSTLWICPTSLADEFQSAHSANWHIYSQTSITSYRCRDLIPIVSFGLAGWLIHLLRSKLWFHSRAVRSLRVRLFYLKVLWVFWSFSWNPEQQEAAELSRQLADNWRNKDRQHCHKIIYEERIKQKHQILQKNWSWGGHEYVFKRICRRTKKRQ